MGQVVSHLRRITKIQRLLTDQIEVLEMMTPLDFLEFRDVLIPASGFQSVQFRLIENKLGLDTDHRLRIKGMPYTSVLSTEHAAALEASEGEPSLHDHLERWLRRTPFLSFGGFDFWRAYREAVGDMLARDRAVIEAHPQLDAEGRAAALTEFEATMASFDAAFDANQWAELVRAGKRRLSYRAFLAALLINLYRDEPILHVPYRLLALVTDVDRNFTTWRQRHAQMAQRMIGTRIGTGGSSGSEYLGRAAQRHKVFGDLVGLSSFFIPRSALPKLPAAVKGRMGFRFGKKRTSSRRSP